MSVILRENMGYIHVTQITQPNVKTLRGKCDTLLEINGDLIVMYLIKVQIPANYYREINY